LPLPARLVILPRLAQDRKAPAGRKALADQSATVKQSWEKGREAFLGLAVVCLSQPYLSFQPAGRHCQRGSYFCKLWVASACKNKTKL